MLGRKADGRQQMARRARERVVADAQARDGAKSAIARRCGRIAVAIVENATGSQAEYDPAWEMQRRAKTMATVVQSTEEILVLTSWPVGGRRLRANAILTSVATWDLMSSGTTTAMACDPCGMGDGKGALSSCVLTVATNAGLESSCCSRARPEMQQSQAS